MKIFKIFLITSITFLMIAGCQTIKEKTDRIVEKENEKLSKYINKPASTLQMAIQIFVYVTSSLDMICRI